MKKIATSMILTLALSLSSMAQTTVIKGAVRDSLSNEGEISAILQFFKEGIEKPIAFTTTDVDGNFAHKLTGKGNYRILFTNVGRKEVSKYFVLEGQDTVNIGVILAQDDVETLKSAKVTAQRILVRMDVDKMTYDVEEDVDSKTSTVLDMLRKVPMVTVDGQDNITVNGSSNFQVTVDGKPNQMLSSNPSQIFKMMPASTVKNIEVITNPGVKYDAEGVGGVLNLTTNKAVTGGTSAADGTYGSVRGLFSTKGSGLGLFVSRQKGKFNWNMNANVMDSKIKGMETDVERTRITPQGNSTVTSHSELEMKMPMAMGNLSASYEIDTCNLVSASFGLMHFNANNAGISSTTLPFGTYSQDLDTRNTMNSITASVDYQHSWAEVPGRMITLSYQFAGSPGENASINLFDASGIQGLDLTSRKTIGRTGSFDNTFQIDYTTPLGKFQTISNGIKYLNRHNSSDEDYYLLSSGNWTKDETNSLDYDFWNRIGAIYTEYSANLGIISFKAGVRYEHTWQEIKAFHTNYGSLVPSASIQYNIAQNKNVGLSYNMRISRPGISYLNPYVDRSDPTALSYGNSDLAVEKAHNISLIYNYFTPKFMLNLTIRDTYAPAGISQYSFYDSENLLNTTYGNIVKSNVAGLNVFANWSPTAKTRIFLNGGANYSAFSSDLLDQSSEGFGYNFMVGLQQTLPADFRLSANVINSGRTLSLQGYSTGISLATLGVTKTFLDDKFSISVMGNTHLSKGKGMKMTSFSEGSDFVNTTTSMIPMRALILNIGWTFGKQGHGNVKSTRRTIEKDEVLNARSTSETIGGSLMGGGM